MPGLDRPFSVDLRGLEDGRHEITLAEPGAALELPADEVSVDGAVILDLVLGISGTLITARGQVRAKVRLFCSRCLEPFTEDTEGSFETVVRRTGENLRPEDEDDIPVYLGDDWAGFDAAVRESLILSIPMKPLCGESCRGLCPVCGGNLNETECTCSREGSDPRWEGLRTLLD